MSNSDSTTSSQSSDSSGSSSAPTPAGHHDPVKLVRGTVYAVQGSLTQRVPLGRVPFHDLVTQPGMLFIDKTAALKTLGSCLSRLIINIFRRPRGFGLRSVVEMIADLYDWNYADNEPEIFSNLAVGRGFWTLKPDDRFQCVVLRLDFHDCNLKLGQVEDFGEALRSYIRRQVEEVLDIYEPLLRVDRPTLDMDRLSFVALGRYFLQACPRSHPLFIVIQNYNGFGLSFDDKEIASVLTDLYADLADATLHYFIRVLLTGYSQPGENLGPKHTPLFSSTSIYYEDLSTHSAFGALCGFTEAEVRDYETALEPSILPYFKSRPIMDNLHQLGNIQPSNFVDERIWINHPWLRSSGWGHIQPSDGDVYSQNMIIYALASRYMYWQEQNCLRGIDKTLA